MGSRKTKRNSPSLMRLVMALSAMLLVLTGFAVGWKWVLSQPVKNPYKPEDFVYENGYLKCLTTESTLGIDVSRYQGDIDWAQVRSAGVEFVFVRVGYRSTKDGLIYEDPRAKENLRGAGEAGLKVGAYFFSQATSPQEAQEEAEFALSIVEGHELSLPIAYDWEFVEGYETNMTRETLTACIHSFCSTVEGKGYEPMVYFNRDLADKLLDMKELTDYKIWFAMYDSYPDAPCKPDYWQYTQEGTVPGIQEPVDLNLFLP